jgi:hypothetical protein
MTFVLVTDGPVRALIGCRSWRPASRRSSTGDRRVRPEPRQGRTTAGSGNSAYASLDNLGFRRGPVLGGILVAIGGTNLAFVINALTFLVIA